jgi:hypothetical protein
MNATTTFCSKAEGVINISTSETPAELMHLDLPDWNDPLLSVDSLPDYCFNEDAIMMENKPSVLIDCNSLDAPLLEQEDANDHLIRILLYDNADHRVESKSFFDDGVESSNNVSNHDQDNYPYVQRSSEPDLTVINKWINQDFGHVFYDDSKDDDNRTNSTVEMDYGSNGNLSLSFEDDYVIDGTEPYDAEETVIEVNEKNKQHQQYLLQQDDASYSGYNFTWLIEADSNEEEGGLYFKLQSEGGAFMKLSPNEILCSVKALITENTSLSNNFLVKTMENRFYLIDDTKVLSVIEEILLSHRKAPNDLVTTSRLGNDDDEETDTWDDDYLSILCNYSNRSLPTTVSPTSTINFPVTPPMEEQTAKGALLRKKATTLKTKIGSALKTISRR